MQRSGKGNGGKKGGKQRSGKDRKRSAEDKDEARPAKIGGGEVIGTAVKREEKRIENEEGQERLVFEDPFGDDFESEGEPLDAQGNEMSAALEAAGEEGAREGEKNKDVVQKKIFRPGVDALGEDEMLVFDASAYDMLHPVQVEWPALSFDFLRDNIPGSRNAYPKTAYAVIGSQADRPSKNQLTVIKLSNMHKTKRRAKKDEDEEGNDSEDDEDDDADSDEEKRGDSVLEHFNVKHDGGVNRVRSMPQRPNIVATWSDTGRVNVFDVQPCLDALDRGKRLPHPNEPLPSATKAFFSFGGHKNEGFAMDWYVNSTKGHILAQPRSVLKEGRMVTGDCARKILLWEPTEDGRFSVELSPFRGHTDSVEDLQWSPTEPNVFASCSVDKSIRFWDTRQRKSSALAIPNAHESDVNVISWNKIDSHLLVSGGDEGHIKVWDLRAIKDGEATPAAFFEFHKKPITSIEWHPTESSMLGASCEDQTISLWDLAVERDPEEEARLGVVLEGADELPPQLLFLHTGQRNIKEIHWHPQLPSVMMSTAEDGLNIFRAADIV